MNKKVARKKKKLISQVRDHRVLPNGRILSRDGRETLLGNLAPVRHIPMLPWKHVIAFPTANSQISVAAEGENSWFYKMLEQLTHRAHDLIGFTPVKTLDATTFEQVGVGSVGIAVQIQKIEPPANGRAIVHLKGVCRYENTGFLASTEDHFNINVRWFEDNRDAEALIKPEIAKCMDIFRQISVNLPGADAEDVKKRTELTGYDFTAAQYLSFTLLEGVHSFLDEDEKLELLLTRSTSKRIKRLNEHFQQLLEEITRRFKKRMKG